MPKVEWGKKILCPSCEVRFYDLNRKYPLNCPSCGSNVDEISIGESSSESKKVFSDDVKSANETNLVGSDATESIASESIASESIASESIASEDSLSLDEVDDADTISLEEADQDVEVIDNEVDDLSIEQQTENQAEEE